MFAFESNKIEYSISTTTVTSLSKTNYLHLGTQCYLPHWFLIIVVHSAHFMTFFFTSTTSITKSISKSFEKKNRLSISQRWNNWINIWVNTIFNKLYYYITLKYIYANELIYSFNGPIILQNKFNVWMIMKFLAITLKEFEFDTQLIWSNQK